MHCNTHVLFTITHNTHTHTPPRLPGSRRSVRVGYSLQLYWRCCRFHRPLTVYWQPQLPEPHCQSKVSVWVCSYIHWRYINCLIKPTYYVIRGWLYSTSMLQLFASHLRIGLSSCLTSMLQLFAMNLICRCWLSITPTNLVLMGIFYDSISMQCVRSQILFESRICAPKFKFHILFEYNIRTWYVWHKVSIKHNNEHSDLYTIKVCSY